MKAATAALQALLASPTAQLLTADLYAITLVTGQVLRWSSLDRDTVFNSNVYTKGDQAVSRTAIKQQTLRQSREAAYDVTITVAALGTPIVALGLTLKQALVAGLFDGATVTVNRIFNPALLTNGQASVDATAYGSVVLFVGFVADVEIGAVKADVVVVAFGTGLRPNENFGLKRADIDLGNRIVRVRQTFSRWGEGTVKNKRARRDLVMTDAVYAALRAQISATELRFVWLWPMSPSRPQPHGPQRFSSKNWPAILKRAGVKHREFYQCRHTFATRLLQEGAELQAVAEQMGHANLQMLIDHYLKWKPGQAAGKRQGTSNG
ncbi:MAG TPA: tyrosine-type recombinase/integrase [Candidatus Binataceae bacterium]|nr:tyrosine-type recombinase/integrase [Candidatus Binataceae bacterium]